MDTKYFKVTPQRKVPKKRTKNTYRIHLNFMYGDADHFEKTHRDCKSPNEFDFSYRIYTALFKKESDEVDFAELLEPILDEYVDVGLKTMDEYVKYGFEEWFDEWFEDWPYDMPCDCFCTLWELSVTYFDDEGIERKVEVTKKD